MRASTRNSCRYTYVILCALAIVVERILEYKLGARYEYMEIYKTKVRVSDLILG